jgi:hypothetical protein
MKCSDLAASEPRTPRRGKPRKELFPAPACRQSRVLYAEVPRNQIALYRFLLEGYDNLAIMSVVDRYRAVIKVRFTPDSRRTLCELLASLGARIIDPQDFSIAQAEELTGVVSAALP